MKGKIKSTSPAMQRAGKIAKYAVLSIWSIITLFPVLWVFMTAFKDNGQIFGNPFALPDPLVSDNLTSVFEAVNFGTSFLNSFIFAAATVVVILLITSMSGYYCAKLTRGMKMYSFLILGMMMPAQTILIPIFTNYVKVGLNNTRIGLILMYVGLNIAFGTFILTGFMKGVPDAVIESGVIDGASSLRAFFSLVIPMAKPGLATVGTFVFLNTWNDFMIAFIMATDVKLQTLNLACYQLRGVYSSDFGLLSAGCVILMTPAIIIFIVFQEQVIKGLTAGAVKG
ncbi:carbohydrate ABC transporter permease [Massilimaliae timonensis]|uniref:Carbohydrate ABC transporter permease n=1 Tax=Massiliimalia timonensis TaxID=1987501 RepID=A0A8J6TX74_9FIRM|nr:carbohydrate ABC transporter permease [Massiliimalia timonensis]MBC8610735.1 carbohydrate ABC transporter permease [Massiliimalia timonensis]